MIYRNQVMKPTQMSTNYLLNKQRKLKYKTHLNKIFEIQHRQYNPKLQANFVQQKISQLTKLKQFARNFKTKQQHLQRLKQDCIMVKHIKQREEVKCYPQLEDSQLRKTKSTMKFNSRIISTSISSKHLINGALLNQQVQKENKRLIKSITENSFDQDRFRQTLKQSTKDYLKIRAHMRRVKGERQSLKKLKTQPVQQLYHRAYPINLISASNNQQLQSQQHNNMRRTQQTAQTTQRQRSFKKSLSRKKKILNMNQSLTQIIDKKLKMAQ